VPDDGIAVLVNLTARQIRNIQKPVKMLQKIWKKTWIRTQKSPIKGTNDYNPFKSLKES